jgi:hypothetical protein
VLERGRTDFKVEAKQSTDSLRCCLSAPLTMATIVLSACGQCAATQAGTLALGQFNLGTTQSLELRPDAVELPLPIHLHRSLALSRPALFERVPRLVNVFSGPSSLTQDASPSSVRGTELLVTAPPNRIQHARRQPACDRIFNIVTVAHGRHSEEGHRPDRTWAPALFALLEDSGEHSRNNSMPEAIYPQEGREKLISNSQDRNNWPLE